jgi:hypothetical protein
MKKAALASAAGCTVPDTIGFTLKLISIPIMNAILESVLHKYAIPLHLVFEMIETNPFSTHSNKG